MVSIKWGQCDGERDLWGCQACENMFEARGSQGKVPAGCAVPPCSAPRPRGYRVQGFHLGDFFAETALAFCVVSSLLPPGPGAWKMIDPTQRVHQKIGFEGGRPACASVQDSTTTAI